MTLLLGNLRPFPRTAHGGLPGPRDCLAWVPQVRPDRRTLPPAHHRQWPGRCQALDGGRPSERKNRWNQQRQSRVKGWCAVAG
jgi:hypothetical protein